MVFSSDIWPLSAISERLYALALLCLCHISDRSQWFLLYAPELYMLLL